VTASNEEAIGRAFETLAQAKTSALLVLSEPFFSSQREKIVTLAARHAIPTIYGLREYAIAGGLMIYGTSISDAYRQVGVYAGRILKGEKGGATCRWCSPPNSSWSSTSRRKRSALPYRTMLRCVRSLMAQRTWKLAPLMDAKQTSNSLGTAAAPIRERLDTFQKTVCNLVDPSGTHADCTVVVLLGHARIRMVEHGAGKVGDISAVRCGSGGCSSAE
jgi:hypothetical protein